MSGKRTYTVPVLLLVLTVLATLIIVLYSRLLLDGQADKTNKGRELADEYNACLAYASLLGNGARDLSASGNAADRLPVKEQLGQIPPVSGQCAKALAEAGPGSGGTSAVAASMEAIWNKLRPIGNHDGALTPEEKAVLQTLADGGAKLEQTLRRYEVPTGDDRLRQMAAGVEWTGPAQQAAKQLEELAAALK